MTQIRDDSGENAEVARDLRSALRRPSPLRLSELAERLNVSNSTQSMNT
ncbi:MAG: hypothetical protein ABR569_09015 [Gaiellaceae bacterium]